MGEFSLEIFEVPIDERCYIGVENSRAPTLEFTVFRQHFMRGANSKSSATESVRHLALMNRVGVAMEEAHCDNLRRDPLKTDHQFLERGLVHRLEHLSRGIQPLTQAKH